MKKVAIVSQLNNNGRLGNQLFQISCCISYALDNGMDYVFPKWEYNKYLQFPLPEGEITTQNRYNEPCFEYSPIPKFDGNVDLFGYFQSEKYFKSNEDAIRHHFQLKHGFCKTFDYSVFQKHKTCGIHIRHGDYLNNPHTNAYHGILPMEYYVKAVSNLLYCDDILFIICSDDPAWCVNNFKFPKMIITNEIDIVDMDIMSHCDDSIIANSSLSWWAAWLNNKPDKRIIAPNDWFKGAGLNTQDLYCEGWIKI